MQKSEILCQDYSCRLYIHFDCCTITHTAIWKHP